MEVPDDTAQRGIAPSVARHRERDFATTSKTLEVSHHIQLQRTCDAYVPLMVMQRLSLHRVRGQQFHAAARPIWLRHNIAPIKIRHISTVSPQQVTGDIKYPALGAKWRQDDISFPAIDAKWQRRWRERDAPSPNTVLPGKDTESTSKYVLPMFPYPSGTLHLGHLRVYTISDVLARFHQMRGHQVIHPIGWDAFGLPAENAAMERGIHPGDWTRQNIRAMKDQMQVMGGRWDWERVATCDPEFYKHTQDIFLMLHERGLVYQAESLVNYDPIDRTVLANEQVDANGCSWRSGAKVEKKMLKQWFLGIREFKEQLLDDLDQLSGHWPERVLAMQRNWLGRSEGTQLWFDVSSREHQFEPIDVFTTRADTLFGVQYIALSLSHHIVRKIAEKDSALQKFIQEAEHLPPDSKAGYLLQGVTATNPLSEVEGSTGHLPIYVAPYVLADYGSGAVMGVPGHDSRDHAFWRTNAGNEPIRQVVFKSPSPSRTIAGNDGSDAPLSGKGFVASDIPGYTRMTSEEAVDTIVKHLEGTGAKKTTTWRLRDWLISRQRYWGTPIPIIHCSSCGPVRVPRSYLPVRLPDLPDSYFSQNAGNPLETHPTWKHTTCPSCGSAATRETDTMDTFMDSSWYFFRFLSPNQCDQPVRPEDADRNMPVDLYIGGVEHAILHLLYARFISKFLSTTPLWPAGKSVSGEPFKRLITQGMVHGKTYTDPLTGRFLKPSEVDLTNPSAPIIIATGQTPKTSFEKMSKSKYNGVDPGTTIATYGADVTRAHMLFQAPVEDVLEWDEAKIKGAQRWLTRVLKTSSYLASQIPPEHVDPAWANKPLTSMLATLHARGLFRVPHATKRNPPNDTQLLAALHEGLPDVILNLLQETQETITRVTSSYADTISLNTIVSDLMKLTHSIYVAPDKYISTHPSTKEAEYINSPLPAYIKYLAQIDVLRMLAPIAPATAEEGWSLLRRPQPQSNTHKQPSAQPTPPIPSIFTLGFPTPQPSLLPHLTRSPTCVFSVDGKRKFEVRIPAIPEEERENKRYILEQLAATDEGADWLAFGHGKVWKIRAPQAPDVAVEGEVEQEGFEGMLPRGWKVVVAQGGMMVNLVSPKVMKGKKGVGKVGRK
ncbi:leucyl-tRNA synthetase [Sporormia fimetaria CBS 119925]|uniref:leucine--tRNA ligase n=1 Tax=Sporormia fimetaria CBS 119925 TaxID=1340428 RepID=A0A6A6V415_9PLEO|nr:leucyl-tRNA synthetase [Sporormia fimetaria CBS 119925]